MVDSRMTAPILFFYDYVDPASCLVERQLARLAPETPIERLPFEVRVPPAPMVDVRDPAWLRSWEGARETMVPEGIVLATPRRVPWTRKAHELALHAGEEGRFPEIHAALFQAFIEEGRDLGRVDVLLEIAVGLGLDYTRAKAVLDVDRHAEAVVAARERAERLGVQGVPTLRAGSRILEGFRSGDDVRTFLARAGDR